MSERDPRLEDFRNFVFLVWDHLGLPTPTPAQFDISHFLQHGPRRRMVQAFRGVGKSWLTAAYVCWRLYLNPQERILVVSANSKRATDFAVFVKRLLHDMPVLQHLRARDGQRDSVTDFDVGPAENHQAPSLKVAGISGQLTGSRATLIVADDVEVPKNSATVVMREKLSEQIKEFDSVLSPGGEIVYLGTPQSEESIYAKQLPQRGYDIRVWPARIPDKADKYGETLAPYVRDLIAKGAVPGDPVDPQRFSDADLTERALSNGRSGWALQFMLDTRLSDAERYPLRCSDFMVMACGGAMGPVKLSWATSPELIDNVLPMLGFARDRWYKPIFVSKDFSDWSGTVMSIDPNGRGLDETGYAVVRMLNGNLYVPAAGGLRGGYDNENLVKLAKIAKLYGVNRIVIESNFGDGMFTELFKPVLAKHYAHCSVEEIRHNIQKEKRIVDTLEPLMNQHRLIIDPEVITKDAQNYNEHPSEKANQYSLIYQLSHLTKERGCLRHDDRIDALAMAVAHWIDIMAKDDTRGVLEAKQKKLDKEIEDYMENLGVTFDSSDTKPTWF